MGEAVAFYSLSALILGFAVLVITAKNTVHSVMFLVVNFLFVAGLYALVGAQFLAVIQVLVYAGGIVVLYLFVVMLVNLKRPPEAHTDPARQSRVGLILALVVGAEIAGIALFGYARPGWMGPAGTAGPLTTHNIEQVGMALYTNYLVPFEVASVLLLVAMVGAIMFARREL